MRLKPCIEDLSRMQETSNGKFCDSCNKTIVDLTQMNQKQIFNTYYDHNGELCGIVSPNQVTESRFYHPLKRFAFAAMLVFGSGLFQFANAYLEVDQGLKSITNDVLKEFEVQHILTGFVYGNKGVLFGVSITVTVDGQNYYGTSDEKGKFSVDLPMIKNRTVFITYKKEGYTVISEEREIKGVEIFLGKKTMTETSCIKMGEMEAPIKEVGIIAPPPVNGEIEPIEMGKVKIVDSDFGGSCSSKFFE